ncbi:hypothetical protein [Endomicrobium proavitum]|uniref:Uncharacterized protein n=1 Tax=Endomicrobium proavitum TaxID=1408281 RepID=A0A0G3WIY5_9BACT|nr:hypothetical protein [Endomicrobium proavitum]AKL98283.1 hypothetical protein Epro_0904 [Endomicrobium proavitum]
MENFLPIRFKHNFLKLENQSSAQLILAKEINFKNDKDFVFVNYDAAYLTDDCSIKFHDLPDGKYLLLLFVGYDNILFTTLRKNNKENREKYAKNVGRYFEIIIEE